MKIRGGFISNSSSSSFILDCIHQNKMPVIIKDSVEEWSQEDILSWVISMVKRECKRNNENIEKEEIRENITINYLTEVIKKYDLPFWYAGRELQYPEEKWVLYAEDGWISPKLASKIIKKFRPASYHLHMG